MLLEGLGRQILLDGLGGALADVVLPPAPPAAIAADAGDGVVTVHWSPVQDAVTYRLYVGQETGVTPEVGTLLAETAGLGFLHDYVHGGLFNGATYYYVVTAVGPGGESAPSPEASATPVAAVQPLQGGHENVLRLLFPLPHIGGAHLGDTGVEGTALDAAHDAATGLLRDMFGDSATFLLGEWERLLSLAPDAGASLTDRRTAILAKLNERAGLSRAYYIEYAARLGWTITITEPEPNVWQVDGVTNDSPIRQFRAGESAAGDRLLSFTRLVLADIFDDIKPAHTVCQFSVP